MSELEDLKRRFLAPDAFVKTLGIELLSVTEDSATISMVVRPDMGNAHGIGHGGAVFTLADTAFGIAVNSQTHLAVTAGADINFLKPATVGSTLTAIATRQSAGRSSALYSVSVTEDQGRLIAMMTARAHMRPRV